MHADVVEIGFEVRQTDGRTGGSGSSADHDEIIKRIRRFNFPVTWFGSSSADTAYKTIRFFEYPIIDRDHSFWNAHRMYLASKDLFKKCIDAEQIVKPFTDTSRYLTGKRPQCINAWNCACDIAKIPFKQLMEL